MKAEDIGAFDVIPSWERPKPTEDERFAYREEPSIYCQCGLCRLAAEGHL